MGTVISRSARYLGCSVVLVLASGMTHVLAAQTPPTSQTPSTDRIVIAASQVFDGKGGVMQNRRIVIEGSKIVAIEPYTAGPVDYDLRGLTVMPGWIDAHVHITWIFGKDGKNAGTGGHDARATLSRRIERLGHADGGLHHGAKRRRAQRCSAARRDRAWGDSRAAHFNCGRTAGRERRETGTPEEIRAFVRKQKADWRGLDQDFRLEVDSPWRRDDAVVGAIERSLRRGQEAGPAHAGSCLQGGGARGDAGGMHRG